MRRKLKVELAFTVEVEGDESIEERVYATLHNAIRMYPVMPDNGGMEISFTHRYPHYVFRAGQTAKLESKEWEGSYHWQSEFTTEGE